MFSGATENKWQSIDAAELGLCQPLRPTCFFGFCRGNQYPWELAEIPSEFRENNQYPCELTADAQSVQRRMLRAAQNSVLLHAQRAKMMVSCPRLSSCDRFPL